MKYFIEFIIVVYCMAESFYHAYLIGRNKPINHLLWFWAYFFVSLFLIIIQGTLWQRIFFVVCAWLIREMIHSPVLNFLRHKPFFYSDPSPQGSELDKIEGAAIPYIYFASIVILVILQFFI